MSSPPPPPPPHHHPLHTANENITSHPYKNRHLLSTIITASTIFPKRPSKQSLFLEEQSNTILSASRKCLRTILNNNINNSDDDNNNKNKNTEFIISHLRIATHGLRALKSANADSGTIDLIMKSLYHAILMSERLVDNSNNDDETMTTGVLLGMANFETLIELLSSCDDDDDDDGMELLSIPMTTRRAAPGVVIHDDDFMLNRFPIPFSSSSSSSSSKKEEKKRKNRNIMSRRQLSKLVIGSLLSVTRIVFRHYNNNNNNNNTSCSRRKNEVGVGDEFGRRLASLYHKSINDPSVFQMLLVAAAPSWFDYMQRLDNDDGSHTTSSSTLSFAQRAHFLLWDVASHIDTHHQSSSSSLLLSLSFRRDAIRLLRYGYNKNSITSFVDVGSTYAWKSVAIYSQSSSVDTFDSSDELANFHNVVGRVLDDAVSSIRCHDNRETTKDDDDDVWRLSYVEYCAWRSWQGRQWYNNQNNNNQKKKGKHETDDNKTSKKNNQLGIAYSAKRKEVPSKQQRYPIQDDDDRENRCNGVTIHRNNTEKTNNTTPRHSSSPCQLSFNDTPYPFIHHHSSSSCQLMTSSSNDDPPSSISCISSVILAIYYQLLHFRTVGVIPSSHAMVRHLIHSFRRNLMKKKQSSSSSSTKSTSSSSSIEVMNRCWKLLTMLKLNSHISLLMKKYDAGGGSVRDDGGMTNEEAISVTKACWLLSECYATLSTLVGYYNNDSSSSPRGVELLLDDIIPQRIFGSIVRTTKEETEQQQKMKGDKNMIRARNIAMDSFLKIAYLWERVWEVMISSSSSSTRRRRRKEYDKEKKTTTTTTTTTTTDEYDLNDDNVEGGIRKCYRRAFRLALESDCHSMMEMAAKTLANLGRRRYDRQNHSSSIEPLLLSLHLFTQLPSSSQQQYQIPTRYANLSQILEKCQKYNDAAVCLTLAIKTQWEFEAEDDDEDGWNEEMDHCLLLSFGTDNVDDNNRTRKQRQVGAKGFAERLVHLYSRQDSCRHQNNNKQQQNSSLTVNDNNKLTTRDSINDDILKYSRIGRLLLRRNNSNQKQSSPDNNDDEKNKLISLSQLWNIALLLRRRHNDDDDDCNHHLPYQRSLPLLLIILRELGREVAASAALSSQNTAAATTTTTNGDLAVTIHHVDNHDHHPLPKDITPSFHRFIDIFQLARRCIQRSSSNTSTMDMAMLYFIASTSLRHSSSWNRQHCISLNDDSSMTIPFVRDGIQRAWEMMMLVVNSPNNNLEYEENADRTSITSIRNATRRAVIAIHAIDLLPHAKNLPNHDQLLQWCIHAQTSSNNNNNNNNNNTPSALTATLHNLSIILYHKCHFSGDNYRAIRVISHLPFTIRREKDVDARDILWENEMDDISLSLSNNNDNDDDDAAYDAFRCIRSSHCSSLPPTEWNKFHQWKNDLEQQLLILQNKNPHTIEKQRWILSTLLLTLSIGYEKCGDVKTCLDYLKLLTRHCRTAMMTTTTTTTTTSKNEKWMVRLSYALIMMSKCHSRLGDWKRSLGYVMTVADLFGVTIKQQQEEMRDTSANDDDMRWMRETETVRMAMIRRVWGEMNVLCRGLSCSDGGGGGSLGRELRNLRIYDDNKEAEVARGDDNCGRMMKMKMKMDEFDRYVETVRGLIAKGDIFQNNNQTTTISTHYYKKASHLLNRLRTTPLPSSLLQQHSKNHPLSSKTTRTQSHLIHRLASLHDTLQLRLSSSPSTTSITTLSSIHSSPYLSGYDRAMACYQLARCHLHNARKNGSLKQFWNNDYDNTTTTSLSSPVRQLNFDHHPPPTSSSSLHDDLDHARAHLTTASHLLRGPCTTPLSRHVCRLLALVTKRRTIDDRIMALMYLHRSIGGSFRQKMLDKTKNEWWGWLDELSRRHDDDGSSTIDPKAVRLILNRLRECLPPHWNVVCMTLCPTGELLLGRIKLTKSGQIDAIITCLFPSSSDEEYETHISNRYLRPLDELVNKSRQQLSRVGINEDDVSKRYENDESKRKWWKERKERDEELRLLLEEFETAFFDGDEVRGLLLGSGEKDDDRVDCGDDGSDDEEDDDLQIKNLVSRFEAAFTPKEKEKCRSSREDDDSFHSCRSQDVDTTTSDDNSSSDDEGDDNEDDEKIISKMTVVQIKGELECHGVEKKTMRGLRKAGLIDLLLIQRREERQRQRQQRRRQERQKQKQQQRLTATRTNNNNQPPSTNINAIPTSPYRNDPPISSPQHHYNITPTTTTSPKNPPPTCLLLTLDENLHRLPIENLPLLQTQPITRLPTLPFLFPPHNNNNNNTPAISPRYTTYIIDPESNLHGTRQTLQPIIQSYAKRKGYEWDGVIGKIPSRSSGEFKPEILFPQLKKRSGLFLYCGHGGGDVILSRKEVERLGEETSCGDDGSSAVVLMGCSSGRLIPGGSSKKTTPIASSSSSNGGYYEPEGMVTSYLSSGIPCVVGNLWDVTDRDIDRYTTSLLEGLCGSSGDGEEEVMEGCIAQCVAEARGACKMRYIVGCAPVCFGLPVSVMR